MGVGVGVGVGLGAAIVVAFFTHVSFLPDLVQTKVVVPDFAVAPTFEQVAPAFADGAATAGGTVSVASSDSVRSAFPRKFTESLKQGLVQASISAQSSMFILSRRSIGLLPCRIDAAAATPRRHSYSWRSAI